MILENKQPKYIIGLAVLVIVVLYTLYALFFVFLKLNSTKDEGVNNNIQTAYIFDDEIQKNNILQQNIEVPDNDLPEEFVSASIDIRDMHYSIEYPDNFWLEEGVVSDNIINFDYNGNWPPPDRPLTDLKIQIQKSDIPEGHKTLDDFIIHLKTRELDFSKPGTDVKIGDDIVLYRYTENGPGGAFANYFAFDEKRNDYYRILVFESGYSNNKELVLDILSTFVIE